jgi:hypothetical protein
MVRLGGRIRRVDDTIDRALRDDHDPVVRRS